MPLSVNLDPKSTLIKLTSYDIIWSKSSRWCRCARFTTWKTCVIRSYIPSCIFSGSVKGISTLVSRKSSANLHVALNWLNLRTLSRIETVCLLVAQSAGPTSQEVKGNACAQTWLISQNSIFWLFLSLRTDRILRQELTEKTQSLTKLIVAALASQPSGCQTILVLDQRQWDKLTRTSNCNSLPKKLPTHNYRRIGRWKIKFRSGSYRNLMAGLNSSPNSSWLQSFQVSLPFYGPTKKLLTISDGGYEIELGSCVKHCWIFRICSMCWSYP